MNLLVDLDDVTSDARWRYPMIDSEGWDKYHEALSLDKTIAPIVCLINSLWFAKWYIVAVTARPERFRGITMQWLTVNGIYVHELLMRGDKDYRPSPLVKLDLVGKRFANIPRSSFLVIDDREDICMSFKAAGYISLQLHRSVANEAKGRSDTQDDGNDLRSQEQAIR